MKKAAKIVCDTEDTRNKTSQWMQGQKDEAGEFKRQIQILVRKRKETKGDERKDIEEELKETRRSYKRKLKYWENDWWETFIVQFEEAMQKQDIGEKYSNWVYEIWQYRTRRQPLYPPRPSHSTFKRFRSRETRMNSQRK